MVTGEYTHTYLEKFKMDWWWQRETTRRYFRFLTFLVYPLSSLGIERP